MITNSNSLKEWNSLISNGKQKYLLKDLMIKKKGFCENLKTNLYEQTMFYIPRNWYVYLCFIKVYISAIVTGDPELSDLIIHRNVTSKAKQTE